jgi:hypothetical protein
MSIGGIDASLGEGGGRQPAVYAYLGTEARLLQLNDNRVAWNGGKPFLPMDTTLGVKITDSALYVAMLIAPCNGIFFTTSPVRVTMTASR